MAGDMVAGDMVAGDMVGDSTIPFNIGSTASGILESGIESWGGLLIDGITDGT